MAELREKRKFYKEIRLAITLAVDRFYKDLDFDGSEELRKKTIRSVFNEYKSIKQKQTPYFLEEGKLI